MRMILVAFTISAAFAQQIEFAVASVKAAVNAAFGGRFPISGPMAEMIGFGGGPGSKTPGRIHYSGVSLKMILVRAYGMRPYQISGPGWMETERYDIDAKYPAETKPEGFRLMLQRSSAASPRPMSTSPARWHLPRGGPPSPCTGQPSPSWCPACGCAAPCRTGSRCRRRAPASPPHSRRHNGCRKACAFLRAQWRRGVPWRRSHGPSWGLRRAWPASRS
jgi:hypothetical protein